MLYKVTVGRDVYLGSPEEVVLWMSKAEGAPPGGPVAYMRAVAKRLAAHGGGVAVDTSGPDGFLTSLAQARLVRLEPRRESSAERVDTKALLDEGPVAFGDDVDVDDLRRDVFGEE